MDPTMEGVSNRIESNRIVEQLMMMDSAGESITEQARPCLSCTRLPTGLPPGGQESRDRQDTVHVVCVCVCVSLDPGFGLATQSNLIDQVWCSISDACAQFAESATAMEECLGRTIIWTCRRLVFELINPGYWARIRNIFASR
jgi:hypothetical protein